MRNLQVGFVQVQRFGVQNIKIERTWAVRLGANAAVRAFDLVQRKHQLPRRQCGAQGDHGVRKRRLVSHIHGRGVVDARLRNHNPDVLQMSQRRLELLSPVSEIAAQSNVIQHGTTVGEEAREPYHARTVTQPAECR